ncbi:MAG: NfeD family protein [Rikenellaceae bacterium]|nr:NfeD family protein [Rikenellaceae bacterium]
MGYIILLLIFGVLFLIAELVLLPGLSVGALLAMVCYGSAIYLAFGQSATVGIVIVVVAVLSAIAASVFSLRAKTWQRFALKQEIRSKSMPQPADELEVGARGLTLSRLSPMGKVSIAGKIYEAKSLDAYIDPKQEVEVVGFENFSIIVKKIN